MGEGPREEKPETPRMAKAPATPPESTRSLVPAQQARRLWLHTSRPLPILHSGHGGGRPRPHRCRPQARVMEPAGGHLPGAYRQTRPGRLVHERGKFHGKECSERPTPIGTRAQIAVSPFSPHPPLRTRRSRSFIVRDGMRLLTGHLAAAMGAGVLDLARSHPVRYRRFTIRAHHRFLSGVTHQFPGGLSPKHPRRFAPVAHHRRPTRFRVRFVHVNTPHSNPSGTYPHRPHDRPAHYSSDCPSPFWIHDRFPPLTLRISTIHHGYFFFNDPVLHLTKGARCPSFPPFFQFPHFQAVGPIPTNSGRQRMRNQRSHSPFTIGLGRSCAGSTTTCFTF